MSHQDITQLLQVAKQYAEEAMENVKANPTSDTIQIVIVEPNKKPYKQMIPNTLEAMKEIVGGYIEVLPIGATETKAQLILTLNEEGKLLGLPVNRKIMGKDILVGTFFISAANMQGDNITLTDRQCFDIIRKFAPLEVYL
jgi:hypothetical protein